MTFFDAACVTERPLMEARIPQILASPKPTAFQLYLNQPEPEDGRRLLHYSSPERDGAEIRGTKLYWHKNRIEEGKRRPLPDAVLFQDKKIVGTQDTKIRPVRPGVVFAGEVHFRDLTLLELGALLAALELPAGLAHRFGLGKPLGFGSLRIETESLTVRDRAGERERYRSFGAAPALDAATVRKDAEERLRQALRDHHNHGESRLPRVAEDTTLWDLPRSQVLRLLLSWEQAPQEAQTRYVGLEAREDQLKWRDRNVLPGPHQVVQPERPDPLALDPASTTTPRPPSESPAPRDPPLFFSFLSFRPIDVSGSGDPPASSASDGLRAPGAGGLRRRPDLRARR